MVTTYMPYLSLLTVCITVLVAGLAGIYQAANIFVKIAAITELKMRVDRLEQHYNDIIIIKKDIEYIRESLEEIKKKTI